jgi:phosphate transport system permease protein
MTDANKTTVNPSAHPGIREAVEARLKKRHAAERRFRLYGMAAVSFAAFMLVVLVVSIGVQAFSAFQKHYVSFETVLDASRLAPDGTDDPELIAENVQGFYETVRRDLATSFPHSVETDADRLAVGSLVTRLAVIPIARRTAENTEFLGTETRFTTALNDDLDLYLKGRLTAEQDFRLGPVEAVFQRGAATIEGDFAPVLAEVKDALTRIADGQADQLEDVERRAAGLRDRIAAEGAQAELVSSLDAAEAEIAELEASIAALRERASASAARETLDASLPSLMVRTGEHYVKVETLSADRAEGRVLVGTPNLRGNFEGEAARAFLVMQPEASRNVTDQQIAWTRALKDEGRIVKRFNGALLTRADSTYPEIAGALAAIVGSLFTMLVTALLALPVGIAAAIYLEEYAPKNRLTSFIEININNLAAVPSIVFGLLGAAVFLSFFGFPRGAPIVGGLVLALLTLPTVIIASRAALKAVPPSIRDAALALGASKTQSVFHHVLPLAAPGMMTGAIIGLARAVGETAPLLLIGMVAFVAEVPTGPTDEATALPVLIYKWSTGAERAWEPMTAAAIVVLLLFMIAMNALAVFLRRRFERRW